MARVWIPADRLLSILDRVEELDGELDESEARFIFDLRHDRQQYVSLDRADKLLTRLHLHHWFHVLKENGGLADIYEDGVQYGKPDNTNKWVKPAKYATHEERLAAARERYRLKKLREAA